MNKVRLFPASESVEDAYLVQVDMPPLSMDMYDTRQGRDQVYQLLATQLGIEIAKLFYTHDVEELGSRLNPDY